MRAVPSARHKGLTFMLGRAGNKKGDAGWLREQTTRRRIHRRSDGGPERRQWHPDGGPGYRYEWYTESPPYVSRPNLNLIPGNHCRHSTDPAWRGMATRTST